MRLDFLVPGFAKCGTTTLCALLGEHPDIFMPFRKDFRLFDLPDYERRWEEWVQRFETVTREPVIGDGSIWYTDASTEALSRQRILEHFPDVKLILIARDPIERIESAYREMRHSDTKFAIGCPFDLAEALRRFPGVVEDTRYHRRLDNYQRHMRNDRLLVLFLEELVARPEKEIARCFTFLGVDPNVEVPDVRRRLNSRAAKYYDTERMQQLRRDPTVAAALQRIPYPVQNTLLPALGLRKPFPDAPLDWSAGARQLVLGHLAEDARQFLADQGKPLGLWPRFAAMLAERECRS
jgi:hypothetical protein